MNFKMESSIGEFPNIGKFPTLRSPDKSGKNSPALRTNSEIFQGEPLRGEFVENVCCTLWKLFFYPSLYKGKNGHCT